MTSGAGALEGGVDFIIGAGLQCLSYGFHDAVLTDRGFICEERKMLKSFTVAGLLGFVAIVLFSLIGVHAYLDGMSIAGSSAPVVVAQSLGIVAFFMMAVIMIATAGSTLDSTFSSLAKLTARDLPGILGRTPKMNPRIIGIVFMIIFGIVGNLPMIMGADIIAATTISGTMIMGLGPIFLMHGVVKPTKVGFQLAFWIGMALGIVDTVAPAALAFMNVGDGSYANFLGVNLWGAVVCWAAYIVPGLVAQAAEKRAGIEPAWKGRTKEELAQYDADVRRRELGVDLDPEDLAPPGAEAPKKRPAPAGGVAAKGAPAPLRSGYRRGAGPRTHPPMGSASRFARRFFFRYAAGFSGAFWSTKYILYHMRNM